MTMVNVALAPDSVSLYSDTLQYIDKRPVRLAGKKVDLAANGAFAVATRGLAVRGDEYAAALCRCSTMDRAVTIGRRALRLEVERDGNAEGFDVIVAGYLHARGRMAAVRLRSCPKDGVTELWLSDGLTLNPEPIREDHRWRSGAWDETRCIPVAMMQHAIQDKYDFKLCIGGSLWKTTVSRHGAEQRIVALFPDYDQQVIDLGGDALADDVAAFRALDARRAA